MKLEYHLISNFLNHVLVFKSLGTYDFYNAHLKTCYNFFKNKEINYYNLCEFITKLKNDNVCNASINKKILCLKVCLKFNNIYIKDLFNLKKLREEKKTFDYLTKGEVSSLIKYIDNSKLSLQNKLILLLFLETGCRLSELLDIKVNNINLDMNCILLEHTKTSNQRHVMFTEKTKNKYLIPYIKTIQSNYMFNVKKDAIRSLFERTKKQLHLKKFHPHMLRHTYATILITNNTDIEFIRITLGHSNLSTTQRYLHYNINQILSTYKNQYRI